MLRKMLAAAGDAMGARAMRAMDPDVTERGVEAAAEALYIREWPRDALYPAHWETENPMVKERYRVLAGLAVQEYLTSLYADLRGQVRG